MLSFLRSFCYTSACCSNAAPLRASSSAGQSWRLITAWSRVQVLPGPYKKRHPFGCLFCILGQAGLEQGGSDNAVGRVSNQPSRLLLSPRVPTIRNVYRGPTLQLFLTADFFFGGVSSGTRKARHCRRQGNKQPSGLFVSARVPTIRNVYRGPALFGGVPSWLEPKITDTAAEASIK